MEKKLKELYRELKVWDTNGNARSAFEYARSWFGEKEEERQRSIRETGQHLSNVFKAMEDAFGEGQEMVLFLSELNAGYYSLKFINECGNEEYYRYNRLLLLKERNADLRKEILEIMDQF